MNTTRIEWVKNPDNITQGKTWNPITGCLNGCTYCWARKLANGRLSNRYMANFNFAPVTDIVPRLYEHLIDVYNDPFYPRFWPEKLGEIKRPPAPTWFESNVSYTIPIEFIAKNIHAKRKHRGIFVCDMSDLFGIGVPEDWTRQVMDAIRLNHADRFYLCTKQPQNLAKWSPFPPNCWVGVSVTTGDMARCILAPLAQIEAEVKYISYEPLLEPIPCAHAMNLVDWIIIGALTCTGGDLSRLSFLYPELKPMPWGNRYVLAPKVEWVREIVEAADKAGVKVFLKNSLKSLILPSADNYRSLGYYGGPVEYTEWKLRQEMLECKPV